MRLGLRVPILATSFFLWAGCSDPGDSAAPPDRPAFAPAPAVLPRLTATQYRNTLVDVFGGALPAATLEPDTNPYLFYSIGAATTTLSELGTQRYADAAAQISDALFADKARRDQLLRCTPMAADDGCAAEFTRRVGRGLFRRPLSDDDTARWLAVAKADAEGDPARGLRLMVYGMLQSPRFLYRVEVGEPDPQRPGRRRYDSYEMAQRLSFLLWDGPPDAELAAAADRGELRDPESLAAQARRLLASPRARGAVQSFFEQYLNLPALARQERDPARYPAMTPTLWASMRAEVQLIVDDLVFRRAADIRELFSTHRTFVNAELSRLYQVNAPGASPVAFVPVELPADGPRAGILTLGAFLAMNAHPTDTSPTLRGKYVRERVLCQLVPPPPGNVNTNIDTSGQTPRSLRERLEEHRKNPACRGCHTLMDPPGYLFERFDAIGAFRTESGGLPLDTHAEVEGVTYNEARELAASLQKDPRVASCLVKQLYRHANARIDQEDDAGALFDLERRFEEVGYRFAELLVALVQSEGFRTLADPVATPMATLAAPLATQTNAAKATKEVSP